MENRGKTHMDNEREARIKLRFFGPQKYAEWKTAMAL